MIFPPLIIPAYNPNEKLLELIAAHRLLCSEQDCIVIDDGSHPSCAPIFNAIKDQKIQVIHHEKNKGKGEALKTAMRYILAHYPANALGMITADADGQHAIEDIIKLNQALLKEPNKLHIGIRQNIKHQAPLRSRIGNRLTRFLYNQLTKSQIEDTQTGLRAIPWVLMQKMISSKSSHYEFEFEMLFVIGTLNLPLSQIPIQTIYIENNAASHFHPFMDSLKIYWVFFRFCSVSFFSFCIDFLIFCFLFGFFKNIWHSVISARMISAGFNFILNQKLSFQCQKPILPTFLKFFILAILMVNCSYQLLQLILLSGVNIYFGKILADAVLFVSSFFIQYFFIFYRRKHA